MKAEKPDLNVEILGINQIGAERSNTLVTQSSHLAWLQDTLQENVWNRWRVTYRDVQVLDAENRLAGVLNLTTHDLGVSTNRQALAQILRNAARVVDTDQDGLPDAWERQYFGDLTPAPSDDTDADGRPHQEEFAFGTDPRLAHSGMGFLVKAVMTNQAEPAFEISFRRLAGSFLNYRFSTSDTASPWAANGATIIPGNTVVQYDGTGTSLSSFVLVPPPGAALGFVRIEAEPR